MIFLLILRDIELGTGTLGWPVMNEFCALFSLEML